MQTNALPLASGIHRLFPDNEAAIGPYSRKGNYHGQDCRYRLRPQHPALRPSACRDRSRADGVRPYFAAQRRPPPFRPLRLPVKDFGASRRRSTQFPPKTCGPGFSGALFCPRLAMSKVAATNSPQRQNGATRRIACWHLKYQAPPTAPARLGLIAGMEGAIHQHRVRFDGSPERWASYPVARVPRLSQRRGCRARGASLQSAFATLSANANGNLRGKRDQD
jgi:hypothetical protein